MSDCGLGGVIAFPLEVNAKVSVTPLKEPLISSKTRILFTDAGV